MSVLITAPIARFGYQGQVIAAVSHPVGGGAMSTLTSTPIARLDYRLRVAATLLRAAPRAEHFLVGGMALASAAAAWPFAGALYPAVAIPALLALAALIRHHLDGLDARREALTAAGADPADALVIQVAGPLGATCAGAVVGIGACVALGRPPAHALAAARRRPRRRAPHPPHLARRPGPDRRFDRGAATAALVHVSASTSAAPPLAEARSRGGAHLPHVATPPPPGAPPGRPRWPPSSR